MKTYKEPKEDVKINHEMYPLLVCPRCGYSNIWDLGENIICLNCDLVFNKSTLLLFGLENALSEEEKTHFIRLLLKFSFEKTSS